MSSQKPRRDDTVGQPRRASDSRPRPGSGTPTDKQPRHEEASPAPTSAGERKPSESSSAIDPGRPAKSD